jgi:predicted ATPase
MANAAPTVFASFGAMLRHLRRRALLTQSALGIAVGYSEPHIARLERGERLPDPAVVQAQFVPALGLDRDPEIAQQLIRLAHAARGDALTATEAGATRRTDKPPGFVPAPPTALIGRWREVAATCNQMLRKSSRLVTLVGPPGVGKTRLALEVARKLRPHFADGVFFVPLASLNDIELVAPTVAQALGLVESHGISRQEQMTRFLSGRQVLLVLDNFEHLSPAAPLLAEWLATCPALRILVTSREALRLRGERLMLLRPLDVPPAQTAVEDAALLRYPAVELFAARAGDAAPDFALDPRNAGAVAALCRRLDGLPLAIELAAGRANMMSPQALLEQLDAGGAGRLGRSTRDAPERHRTLRDAIDWSYRLLSPREQRLFRWLGVFSGGFTLDAAQEMCGASDLDIQSLLDKSLLRSYAPPGEPAATRFGLLELLREFALEQLDANGEGDGARQKHAACFLAFAEDAGPRLSTHGQLDWFRRIGREVDNLRAALGYSLDHGDPETALRITGALRRFWHWRDHSREGLAWATRALEAGADLPAAVRSKALVTAGATAFYLGNQAFELVDKALAGAREAADDAMIVQAAGLLSNLELKRNDLTASLRYAEQALAHAQASGSDWLIADAKHKMGLALVQCGKLTNGTILLEQSRVALEGLGDHAFAAVVDLSLGWAAIAMHDDVQLAACLRRILLRDDEMASYELSFAISLSSMLAAMRKFTRKAACLGGAAENFDQHHGFASDLDKPQFISWLVQNFHMTIDNPEDFAAAWAEGRAMSVEEAVACALSDGE